MEFNRLPEDYGETKLGPQKRQTEFDSPEAKLAYDANGLIRKERLQSKKLGSKVDPITFAQREDDNINALQAAINKEQGRLWKLLMTETGTESAEPSPEQLWLGAFRARFEAMPKLHTGILWADVEKALRADYEAVKKLQALDKKGHAMNVFGERDGGYILVSAWSDYRGISADHRDIVYDKGGQDWLAKYGHGEIYNGNAIDIAEALGVNLANSEFDEQLKKAISINGSAWLKQNYSTIGTGYAPRGYSYGISRSSTCEHSNSCSFRAMLWVKKA